MGTPDKLDEVLNICRGMWIKLLEIDARLARVEEQLPEIAEARCRIGRLENTLGALGCAGE